MPQIREQVRQSSTPHKRFNLPGNKSTLQMCIVVAGMGYYVEIRMDGWWRTGKEGCMRPRASKESVASSHAKKLLGMCVWVRDQERPDLVAPPVDRTGPGGSCGDSILIMLNKDRVGEHIKGYFYSFPIICLEFIQSCVWIILVR